MKNCQAHQKSNAYQSLLKVIECLLKCFCFFRSAKESSNVNEMDHPSSIPNRFDFIEKWKLRISYFSKCDFAGWLEVSSRLGRRFDRRLPFDECDLLAKLILTAAVMAIRSQTSKLSRSGTAGVVHSNAQLSRVTLLKRDLCAIINTYCHWVVASCSVDISMKFGNRIKSLWLWLWWRNMVNTISRILNQISANRKPFIHCVVEAAGFN